MGARKGAVHGRTMQSGEPLASVKNSMHAERSLQRMKSNATATGEMQRSHRKMNTAGELKRRAEEECKRLSGSCVECTE